MAWQSLYRYFFHFKFQVFRPRKFVWENFRVKWKYFKLFTCVWRSAGGWLIQPNLFRKVNSKKINYMTWHTLNVNIFVLVKGRLVFTLLVFTLTPVGLKWKCNLLGPFVLLKDIFQQCYFSCSINKAWHFEGWVRLMVPQRWCKLGDNPWYEPPLPIIAPDWPTMKMWLILI